MGDKKLIIKKNKFGTGVYTFKSFIKGETIHIMSGRICTPRTIHYHNSNFRKGIIDPLQIGEDRYLELDELSRFINHSCEPNAGMRERSTLFALRDIKAGEELTYDYSTTIDEAFWCRCRSKKCRGIVYDFFALSNRDKLRYYKQNALPKFLMVKFKKLLEGKCYCGSGKKYKRCHGK